MSCTQQSKGRYKCQTSNFKRRQLFKYLLSYFSWLMGSRLQHFSLDISRKAYHRSNLSLSFGRSRLNGSTNRSEVALKSCDDFYGCYKKEIIKKDMITLQIFPCTFQQLTRNEQK